MTSKKGLVLHIQKNAFTVNGFPSRSRLWLVFFYQLAILHSDFRVLSCEDVFPAIREKFIMTVKIGVLSDTHLSRVTKEFKSIFDEYLSEVDLIFHAGDFVSTEIVEFLGRKEFRGVQGNMDSMAVRDLLPEKTLIELGEYKIGMIHGWGPGAGLEERVRDQFQGVDAIVYGHSHRPANHMKDGILLFNPGTAMGYTSSGIHSLGLLELGDTIRGEIVRL